MLSCKEAHSELRLQVTDASSQSSVEICPNEDILTTNSRPAVKGFLNNKCLTPSTVVVVGRYRWTCQKYSFIKTHLYFENIDNLKLLDNTYSFLIIDNV